VSGAVTIVCNKRDVQDCHVGDLLQWEPSDCGLTFHGLPRNWSCPKISRAPSAHIPGSVNLGNELFGPSVPLDLMPKDGGDKDGRDDNTNLFDNKNDNGNERGTVELSREIATVLRHQLEKVGRYTTDAMMKEDEAAKEGRKDAKHLATMGNLLSFVDRQLMAEGAHHPKHYVEIIATFFFSLIGEENAHDWEQKLYDPESAWWCEEPRPTNAGSMDWIDHMFGYGAMIPMYIDPVGKSVKFNCGINLINCFCGGRSRGWFLRMIVPMMDFGQTYRWAWRSPEKRVLAQHAATPSYSGALIRGKADYSQILRKAYCGDKLTQDDMWFIISGTHEMNEADLAILREYTTPFLMAGTTARIMPWVAASVCDIYAMAGENDSFKSKQIVTNVGTWATIDAANVQKNNQNITKFVGGYGKTEQQFQEKRLECLKRVAEVTSSNFYFAPLCPEYMVAQEMAHSVAIKEMSGPAVNALGDSWQFPGAGDTNVVRHGELASMTINFTNAADINTIYAIDSLNKVLADATPSYWEKSIEGLYGSSSVAVAVAGGGTLHGGYSASFAKDGYKSEWGFKGYNRSRENYLENEKKNVFYVTEWIKIFLHTYSRTKFEAFAFSSDTKDAIKQFGRILGVGINVCTIVRMFQDKDQDKDNANSLSATNTPATGQTAVKNNRVEIQMATALEAKMKNTRRTALTLTRANQIDETEIELRYLTWYKQTIAKKAGMGLHDGSSRVFGMLLEKSIFANECRVLLMPGLAS